MIQSVSFTSAAFEDFADAYLCFFVSASAKKNAEVIKVSEKKRNAMFCLIKKLCETIGVFQVTYSNYFKVFSVTGNKELF